MKSLHKFRHGLDTVLSWVCALLFAAMDLPDRDTLFLWPPLHRFGRTADL